MRAALMQCHLWTDWITDEREGAYDISVAVTRVDAYTATQDAKPRKKKSNAT